MSQILNKMANGFRIGCVQLLVTADKTKNVARAVELIGKAKEGGAKVVVLPECFNSPYGTSFFEEYSEEIPSGPTSMALSAAAKANSIYLVGGTIPERNKEGKIFNTCTIWSPTGDLIDTFRKIHLFDISIPGKIAFKESDVLTAGQKLTTFEVDKCKIGVGICFDIRFGELAHLYRKQGCHMLIYPGAFNMRTGPLHWELLHRARAVDCQLYIAAVSPARDASAGYVAWGHSFVIDPWGKILKEAKEDEEVIFSDIDLQVVDDFRKQIPVFDQRRSDIYETNLNEKSKHICTCPL